MGAPWPQRQGRRPKTTIGRNPQNITWVANLEGDAPSAEVTNDSSKLASPVTRTHSGTRLTSTSQNLYRRRFGLAHTKAGTRVDQLQELASALSNA